MVGYSPVLKIPNSNDKTNSAGVHKGGKVQVLERLVLTKTDMWRAHRAFDEYRSTRVARCRLQIQSESKTLSLLGLEFPEGDGHGHNSPSYARSSSFLPKPKTRPLASRSPPNQPSSPFPLLRPHLLLLPPPLRFYQRQDVQLPF